MLKSHIIPIYFSHSNKHSKPIFYKKDWLCIVISRHYTANSMLLYKALLRHFSRSGRAFTHYQRLLLSAFEEGKKNNNRKKGTEISQLWSQEIKRGINGSPLYVMIRRTLLFVFHSFSALSRTFSLLVSLYRTLLRNQRWSYPTLDLYSQGIMIKLRFSHASR